jgi:hypothetical protein
MTEQLDKILIVENELVGLMIDGHLPSQVEQQIEQACLIIMQARNLLQFSIEESEQPPDCEELTQ